GGRDLWHARREDAVRRFEAEFLPPALLARDVVRQRPVKRRLVADLDLLLRQSAARHQREHPDDHPHACSLLSWLTCCSRNNRQMRDFNSMNDERPITSSTPVSASQPPLCLTGATPMISAMRPRLGVIPSTRSARYP